MTFRASLQSDARSPRRAGRTAALVAALAAVVGGPATVLAAGPASAAPAAGATSGAASTQAADSRAVAVQTAMAELGTPYQWGAGGPSAFDCSGLTMYAWAKAGRALPHSSSMQYATLPHVAASDMIPGDLVFFGYAGRISHMGMYIGGGRFVHAPHTGDVVKVSALAGYYQAHFIGAARP